MITQEFAASIIDHTLLKPQATEIEIKQLCQEAATYNFASVCVNPYYVKLATEELENSNVKVCTVIGFPLGANTKETKAFETTNAIEAGATEVDMVINISAAKNGAWEMVKADIIAVVEAAKNANKDVVTKVIIETALLTEDEKIKVCTLLLETGADFVKTSTGFAGGGATVEDVMLMKSIVGNKMLIKASGGVRNYKDLLAMVEAGANRIGTSGGVAIVNDETNTTVY